MKILVSLMMLFCLSTVFASDTLIMTANKNKMQFIVSLPANPTTGYQWGLIAYDKKMLQMDNQTYVAPATHLIGAPGHTNFSFQLLKGKTYPSKTTLRFKYARAWEKNGGKYQDVVVIFN